MISQIVVYLSNFIIVMCCG